MTTDREAPATTPRAGSVATPLLSVGVALATMVVLVAVAILLFFNPFWIGFEQERARADLWTGWRPDEVRQVTDSIVAEVYFGPGTFAQVVRGEPVFNAREQGHMADVRRVWLGFLAVAAAALVLLVAAWARARDRSRFWRAVAAGSAVLAVGTVAVALAFATLFDAAFEIFHRLFFAQGTYTFDPGAERMVQLFAYAFWTETSVAIAMAVLGLALAAWAVARWRARRAERAR